MSSAAHKGGGGSADKDIKPSSPTKSKLDQNKDQGKSVRVKSNEKSVAKSDTNTKTKPTEVFKLRAHKLRGQSSNRRRVRADVEEESVDEDKGKCGKGECKGKSGKGERKRKSGKDESKGMGGKGERKRKRRRKRRRRPITGEPLRRRQWKRKRKIRRCRLAFARYMMKGQAKLLFTRRNKGDPYPFEEYEID